MVDVGETSENLMMVGAGDGNQEKKYIEKELDKEENQRKREDV